MTGQTTQKNDLLSIAKEALDAAQADYYTAVAVYVESQSHADKLAMYAALGKLQAVQRQRGQAKSDVDNYQFGKVF